MPLSTSRGPKKPQIKSHIDKRVDSIGEISNNLGSNSQVASLKHHTDALRVNKNIRLRLSFLLF